MKYDPETNILIWEITKSKIDHAKDFGNLIIHLSKNGKPALIEILDASKFIGDIQKIKPKDIKKMMPI